MRNINNTEMKQHPVSPVLLPHKAGALISLPDRDSDNAANMLVSLVSPKTGAGRHWQQARDRQAYSGRDEDC